MSLLDAFSDQSHFCLHQPRIWAQDWSIYRERVSTVQEKVALLKSVQAHHEMECIRQMDCERKAFASVTCRLTRKYIRRLRRPRSFSFALQRAADFPADTENNPYPSPLSHCSGVTLSSCLFDIYGLLFPILAAATWPNKVRSRCPKRHQKSALRRGGHGTVVNLVYVHFGKSCACESRRGSAERLLSLVPLSSLHHAWRVFGLLALKASTWWGASKIACRRNWSYRKWQMKIWGLCNHAWMEILLVVILNWIQAKTVRITIDF